jgi:cystathionine beta-lyase/cystathionine gamma-synthase
MTRSRPGRSTIAIHGRPARKADWAPVVSPIVQSTTFVNPVGSDEEVLYTRYGNNPNQVELAHKYALLEGAEAALFVSSGMGATSLAHLAILRPGDHLLASRWVYGGTQKLFDEEFSRLGISVTYVDPSQYRLWRRALRKTTRAIFIETPTNPLMRVLDLQVVARLASEYGLALLVDATFASPVNFRPLEHGADVVITSATKYLNGHARDRGGRGDQVGHQEVTRR